LSWENAPEQLVLICNQFPAPPFSELFVRGSFLFSSAHCQSLSFSNPLPRARFTTSPPHIVEPRMGPLTALWPFFTAHFSPRTKLACSPFCTYPDLTCPLAKIFLQAPRVPALFLFPGVNTQKVHSRRAPLALLQYLNHFSLLRFNLGLGTALLSADQFSNEISLKRKRFSERLFAHGPPPIIKSNFVSTPLPPVRMSLSQEDYVSRPGESMGILSERFL